MTSGSLNSRMATLALPLVALFVCSSSSSYNVAWAGYAGMDGLKQLFGLKHTIPSYRILANHLYEATKSSELNDNKLAAQGLLDAPEFAKNSAKLEQLVTAFSRLRELNTDAERLCARDNLANLRTVIGAMARGGQQRKMSEPIRRLNRLLIKLVNVAMTKCLPFLEGQYPEEHNKWEPSFSVPRVLERLSKLHSLFESLGLFSGGLVDDKHALGSDLSFVLYVGATDGAWPDANSVAKGYSRNKELIDAHLEEFVFTPCRQLAALPESSSLLQPYANLLVAGYALNDKFVRESYRKSDEQPETAKWRARFDMEWRALENEVCSILAAMDREDLVHQVAQARRESIFAELESAGGGRSHDRDDDDNEGMSVSNMAAGALAGGR